MRDDDVRKAAGLVLALSTGVSRGGCGPRISNKPFALIIPSRPAASKDVVRRLDRHPFERKTLEAGGGRQPAEPAAAGAGSEVASHAPHDGYTC